MWKKEMDVTRQAVQEAGKILNRLFGQIKKVQKKGDIDLVTEADLQSEKIILDIITRHFPRDSIITEEAGEVNHISDRKWIIDPLDGTTNYAHNFPFFAISIALEVKKEVVLGVVFNPYMGEYFEAVKGAGAVLNKKPIHVSQTIGLGDALLATGFPYDVHERPQKVIENLNKMIVIAQGIRRAGSAAIDLCYVAAGKFDGYWEEGLKSWDTAAGSIIVREAGGVLSDYQGNAYSPYRKSIVASNPHIHMAMIRLLGS